ncbi:MinD/ParA family ATP-binding protein [Leekyejoonella antrihumi]|uniref:ParA family protein n=1 Tax=Leekyejoonella antrihumi TaxID=1660198 RepID=A0A563DWZ3_9MICO|nr:hypothetical protein [Leekyejoonella antrihumi]TWP34462.1 hypothetical protein FGL98_17245 [Leekyejoonella antrihumi]
MSVTVVTAGKASPGATTIALALSWATARAVTVVDADPAGGDVVPGMLAGRAGTATGLLSWMVATRRCSATQTSARMAEHSLLVDEPADLQVVPGVQSVVQAPQVLACWDRLATALERAGGREIVVDTGRLGSDSCWPVITGADRVLLVTAPTSRSIHAAVSAASMLRERLGDLDAVWLVVNGPGPYATSAVAEALRMGGRVTRVPTDRRAAAALTEGAPWVPRTLVRSALVRAARVLATAPGQEPVPGPVAAREGS